MERSSAMNNREKNQEHLSDIEFYRQAYEQEKARAASLAGRLADAKNEADNLQFQLDRIKNNPLWKASKPLRQGMHWGLRNYRRIRNLGGPKGIARKLRQKKMQYFGAALEYAVKLFGGNDWLCAGADVSKLGTLPC